MTELNLNFNLPNGVRIRETRDFASGGGYLRDTDAYLRGKIMGYMPRDMVADIVSPFFPVKTRTGSLPKMGTDSMRETNDLAPTNGYMNRVTWDQDESYTWSLTKRGLEAIIPKSIEAEVDVGQLRTMYGVFLKKLLYLSRERRISTVLTTTSNYGGNTSTLSGTSQWSHAGSDPVSDLATAIAAVEHPTHIILPKPVRVKLCSHAQMRTKSNYLPMTGKSVGGLAPLTDEALSQWFMHEYQLMVIRADARYETSVTGQTSSRSAVWGKHCVILSLADDQSEAGLVEPKLTHTYAKGKFRTKEGFDPRMDGGDGATILMARMPDMDDTHILDTERGYLLYNAVA